MRATRQIRKARHHPALRERHNIPLTEEDGDVIRRVEDPVQHPLVDLLDLVGDLEGVLARQPSEDGLLVGQVACSVVRKREREKGMMKG